jgi:hypothetical protein
VNAVPFDTLKLAERLQAGGFTQDQARAAAAAFADVVTGADLATRQDIVNLGQIVSSLEQGTKRDLLSLEQGTKRDLLSLEQGTKRDLLSLEQRLRQDMLLLEQRLTIRLGGMLVVAVGVILAAIRYLPAPPHP